MQQEYLLVKEKNRKLREERKINRAIVLLFLDARYAAKKLMADMKPDMSQSKKDDILFQVIALIRASYNDASVKITDGLNDRALEGRSFPRFLAERRFKKRIDIDTQPVIIRENFVKQWVSKWEKKTNDELKSTFALINNKVSLEAAKNNALDSIVNTDKNKGIHGAAAMLIRINNANSNEVYNRERKIAVNELREKGIKVRRRWRSTLFIRETHAEAHGQFEDENGNFTVGGKVVDRPGNFGEPSEDINCQCVVDEVFEEIRNPDTFEDQQPRSYDDFMHGIKAYNKKLRKITKRL